MWFHSANGEPIHLRWIERFVRVAILKRSLGSVDGDNTGKHPVDEWSELGSELVPELELGSELELASELVPELGSELVPV